MQKASTIFVISVYYCVFTISLNTLDKWVTKISSFEARPLALSLASSLVYKHCCESSKCRKVTGNGMVENPV